MDWKLILGIALLIFAWKGGSSDISIQWPDFLNVLNNKPAVTVVVPASQYTSTVNNLKAIQGISPEDKAALSKFYADFANVLKADDSLVTDTVRFRIAYSLAGKTLFGTTLKGKYPTLAASIDAEMKAQLGDSVAKLDRNKTVDVLNAISYAFGS